MPFFRRRHAATVSKDDIQPSPTTFYISNPHHDNITERVHDGTKIENGDCGVNLTQIIAGPRTSLEEVNVLNSRGCLITQVLKPSHEDGDDRPAAEDIETANVNIDRSEELSYVPSRHYSSSIIHGVDLSRVQISWGSTDVTRVPSLQPFVVDSADTFDVRPRTETVTAPDLLEWQQEEKLPHSVTSSDLPSDLIAQALQPWVDTFIYILIFALGLFIFYFLPSGVAGRALPLFLSLNSLTYLFSIKVVPEAGRKVFHPILVCSIATCLGIWAFGATVGWTIKECAFFFIFIVQHKRIKCFYFLRSSRCILN